MERKNPLSSSITFLAIASSLLAIIYFVLAPKYKDNEQQKEQAKLLYPGVERNDMIEFSVEDNQNKRMLYQRRAENNEEWTVVNEKNFEGDKAAIDGIISSILASKRESTLTSQNLGEFGLDAPKLKLQVTSSKNKNLKTLLLGNDTPVDYYVYAKWADSPEVFLTSRSLRFSLDKKIEDVRNKKVFKKPDLTQVDYLEIKTTGLDQEAPVNIRLKADPAGQWTTTVGTNEVTVEKSEVESFLENVTKLTAKTFVSEQPKDRAKFGLSYPKATLSIKRKDRAEPSVWILGKTREKRDGAFKDVYYWALKEQDTTFEVPESAAETFKVSLFQFRKKTLPSPDLTKIHSISVTGAQNLPGLKFFKQKDTWLVSLGNEELAQAVEAKKELVDIFLSGILNLKAEDFKDGTSPIAAGFTRPTRKIELFNDKGEVLETYTFGKALNKDDQIYLSLKSFSSPSIVRLKIEELIPMDINVFRKEALVTPTASPTKNNNTSSGGKKVKLEPTVSNIKEIKKLPAPIVKPGHKYTATMHISGDKKLEILFHTDEAPYTVSNFLHLARNGFYDNVVFHRVIKDFVVQGGDPTGTGRGGPGYQFDNEDNVKLKHLTGYLSMAHAGRNTNGSQFFIVLKPQPHLDGVHTVFAQITKGLDLIEGIKQGDKMTKVEVFEEAL